MNKKIIITTSILVLFILIGVIGIYPSIYEYQCRTRIYSDLENALTNVFSSNISVITVDEHDGMKGYSVGASGVVFDRIDGRYNALTAYHVVTDQATHLVMTTSDDTLSEYKEKYPYSSVEDYYNQFAQVKVKYTCEESDLAIISFESNKELSMAFVSDDVPIKGDKIALVGTLEENYFTTTYGVITSKSVSTFDANDGQSENKVLQHNAYDAPGSSGGAIFNEEMKLVGINIGGGTDIFGRFRYGAMIPCDQIQQCINDWRNH